ncbi:MAG: CDP-archaeol synthase [Thermodesulfobacteriota bacterium]
MSLFYVFKLFYLILPIILGGISNMILMKLPVLESLKIPMDRGKVLGDGKRLFGDNKTWKGFVGMIIVTSIWMGIFGFLFEHFSWAREVSILPYGEFEFPLDEWFYGAFWGLGYVLFELPNSYIKRRLEIAPGEQARGPWGFFFGFLDQSDSVIGCLIFMLLFFVPTPLEALVIFLLGTGSHYFVNLLLYLVGLKSQAG